MIRLFRLSRMVTDLMIIAESRTGGTGNTLAPPQAPQNARIAFREAFGRHFTELYYVIAAGGRNAVNVAIAAKVSGSCLVLVCTDVDQHRPPLGSLIGATTSAIWISSVTAE
jgi:hypothetical protein